MAKGFGSKAYFKKSNDRQYFLAGKSDTPLRDLHRLFFDFPLYFKDKRSNFKKLAKYIFDQTPTLIRAWKAMDTDAEDVMFILCHNGKHTKCPKTGRAGAEIIFTTRERMFKRVGINDPLSLSLKDEIPPNAFGCIVVDSFGNFQTSYLFSNP